jgi:pyruvate-formate lyase
VVARSAPPSGSDGPIRPGSGEDEARRLSAIVDGFFWRRGQVLKVKVISREILLDAMLHPERHPGLTVIPVCG